MLIVAYNHICLSNLNLYICLTPTKHYASITMLLSFCRLVHQLHLRFCIPFILNCHLLHSNTISGSIFVHGWRAWRKKNMNAHSLLFSNAGVEFSSTYSATEILLSTCYRYVYAKYTAYTTWWHWILCVPCQIHITLNWSKPLHWISSMTVCWQIWFWSGVTLTRQGRR